MKLRYSDKMNIEVSVSGQIPDKTIPPLLFTSFVENAFKHGITVRGSSFVSIAFGFSDENLILRTRNSRPDVQKEDGDSGIGIENSRKRLDLLYADRYSLEIDDKDDEFSVTLILPL
jgi:sensor histidine kinase YesM